MTLFGECNSIFTTCEGDGNIEVVFFTPTRTQDIYRQTQLSFAEAITIQVNIQPKKDEWLRYVEGQNERNKYDCFYFGSTPVLSAGDRCSVFSTLFEVVNIRRWPIYTEFTIKDAH